MNNSKHLSAFYIRCVILLSPLIALLAFYLIKDPFMVIHPKVTDYDKSHIMQNEGVIGWEKLKAFNPTKHYDAFIMGNSCTKSFPCEDWNRYIHGRPFRFFSNAEDIGEFQQMLTALGKIKSRKINHLLVVVDRSFFETADPRRGMIHIMPPDVSGCSWMNFQMQFFQGFMSPKFLFPYMYYLLTGTISNSGKAVIAKYVPTRTLYTNDAVLWQELDIKKYGENNWKELDKNGKYTDKDWVMNMKSAKPHEGPPDIGSQQREALLSIRTFCRAHHTDIQWVISPNSQKEQMNAHDMEVLRNIFGNAHVHDYSACRRFYDYHYFYDAAHYRRYVGNSILKDIYAR